MAERNHPLRSGRRPFSPIRTSRLAAAAVALSLGAGLSTAQADNIYATLEGNDSFRILTTLLRATDIIDQLEADSYTVFAPSDEAFRALPAGTLATLLENPDTLKAILQHHVVAGQGYRADNLPEQLSPVAGGAIDVGIADSGAVLQPEGEDQIPLPLELANIEADNGIIHGINTVLIPQAIHTQLASVDPSGEEITIEQALDQVGNRDYTWEQLDADQDGYVSYTEAETHQLMGGLWDRFDTDRDQRISQTEFERTRRWDSLDRDASGTLTRQEAEGDQRLTGQWDTLDMDDDDQLSEEEFSRLELELDVEDVDIQQQ